jgi:nucleoside-diphosphate-sugar epimerase
MKPETPENLSGQRLVVFGCGYVGGEVARLALELGWEVTALTRNADKAELLRLQGVKVIVVELSSDVWHSQIPAGANYVLNSVSSGGGGLADYRRSYVDGMQSILRWARRGPAGTIVYTSSTSVYPQGDGAMVDEMAPTDGAGETGRVLRESEILLQTNRGRESTAACARWFILRLAGIYGPGRHRLLDQLRSGATELAGRGEQRLNLIHRDDAAAAILAALRAPAAVADEIFNLADDAPVAKAEVVRWLADTLRIPVPSFVSGKVPRRRTAVPDRVISAGKIKRVLGWAPQLADFRAGYEKILSL